MKRVAKYTYADYLALSNDERWELIDGVAYNMTPAPSRKHQEISWKLSRQILAYPHGKKCKAYTAPLAAAFPPPAQPTRLRARSSNRIWS
jgi:Uma2 family endonuclease